MKAVSLSFFRFEGPGNKLWAFSQMLFARRPLGSVPGIGFRKLLGSGTREGFHPFPNFSVYAILATWPTVAEGRVRIAESEVYRRYRAHATEDWTVFRATLREVLETGESGETIGWSNEVSGASGNITPMASSEHEGLPCRRRC